ncbi:MAG: hypothetical protein WCP06_01680 [Verrucomicrobiota bacterium]
MSILSGTTRNSRFIESAGRVIDQLKLNSNSLAVRDGRAFWVKRRRIWGRELARCANVFFRVAQNPVVVLADPDEWRRWEIGSFLLLHGSEGYRAFSEESETVWLEQLPGVSLEDSAMEGRLVDGMLEAAGRELKRAHDLECGGTKWSHGDPHLGNFMYDAKTGHARLIDFEVIHRPELPIVERHADDLLVFLQDLMGRVTSERWVPAATRFLRNYNEIGSDEVLSVLKRRFAPPKNAERVWWSIRTSYLGKAERTERIHALHDSLK